nr:uncharacterized protein LOC117862148 isoform X1 [Setaria viridis]XP_034601559.1 uncharacterized protein LOC117862148 isoform X1 [Setaria viridis]
MEVPMNSAQSGAHFPVQHRSLSLDVKGNKTDIVISKYEDTFLVIVTQIGCMGTILAAKKDESVFSDPTYNVNVLFGKRDEPLLLACAHQLIEHISQQKDLLFYTVVGHLCKYSPARRLLDYNCFMAVAQHGRW